MTPSELLDSARPIILIGGTGAAIAFLVFAALIVLHIRKDERKKRDAETGQALAAARADDLRRHDPTTRENRPYPRETPRRAAQ